MNTITKDMVKRGYKQGLIKLINLEGDNKTVCSIGDYWFCFDIYNTENISPDDYIKNISEEDIVANIFDTLDGFKEAVKKGWDEFEDEYLYYLYYLNEKIS